MRKRLSTTKSLYVNKPKQMWGGFCDGKLDMREIDDYWGGSNIRISPALFTSRKKAMAQYKDVRRIELKPAPNKNNRTAGKQ